ncbi:MAG: hypothetical protein WC869_15135 [Phycisphaerae bacterium]
MKNPQNITLAVLLILAVVLGSMLLVTTSTPVLADSSVRNGDLVFVTGAYSNSRDLLYVLNRSIPRINVYSVDPQKDTVELLDTVDVLKGFDQ